MKGAREYARVFRSGQYGRLYIGVSSHARGDTFHIWILPDGESAIAPYSTYPLNKNAVEVYGIISGNPGWTESYGWLHTGPWVKDFDDLYAAFINTINILEENKNREKEKTLKDEKFKVKQLLGSYK